MRATPLSVLLALALDPALKVFKRGKSAARITKELDYQTRASSYNLAPRVRSTWRIDERHKCFAMERLDLTLLELLHEQHGVLTMKQRDRIIELITALGDRCDLVHNDDNICRNIMLRRSDGELFLIDFGMAAAVTKKVLKSRGPAPNITLLASIDCAIVKLGGEPAFEGFVSDYELQHGVIIDLRRHAAAQRALRMRRYLANS